MWLAPGLHDSRWRQKGLSAFLQFLPGPSPPCLSAGVWAKGVGAGEGCRAAHEAELGAGVRPQRPQGLAAPGKGALLLPWAGGKSAQQF